MADRTRRVPRLPTPETLRRQVVLEEHDLAPDGSFAVVSRRTVDGEHYVQQYKRIFIRHRRRSRPARKTKK